MERITKCSNAGSSRADGMVLDSRKRKKQVEELWREVQGKMCGETRVWEEAGLPWSFSSALHSGQSLHPSSKCYKPQFT